MTKVFDMGKNLPLASKYAVLTSDTIEALKKLCVEAPDGDVTACNECGSLLGIHVLQEDDPITRKCMAISMAMTTGQLACYEDADKGLVVVEMPRSDFHPWGKVSLGMVVENPVICRKGAKDGT